MGIEDKTCASCGRRIEWRKKWARDWESVRYCSDACRRRKVNAVDRELEASLLALLEPGAASRTVDPLDAAKAVARERGEEWGELVEPARRAARRLVASGDVVILQGGRVVDPSTAAGPIRVRRAQMGTT